MITKKDLENYAYLDKCIKETKKKIEFYESNPPKVEYGKVRGSSRCYPYTERSFTVSGYNGMGEDRWRERIRLLKEKLAIQMQEMEDLKLEIEFYILDISDLTTKLIFSYAYIDGLSQEEIAEKLYLEQSTISKRISRHLKTLA